METGVMPCAAKSGDAMNKRSEPHYPAVFQEEKKKEDIRVSLGRVH